MEQEYRKMTQEEKNLLYKENTYGMLKVNMYEKSVITEMIDFMRKNPDTTMLETGIDARLLSNKDYLFSFHDLRAYLYYNKRKVDIDDVLERLDLAIIDMDCFPLTQEDIDAMRKCTQKTIEFLEKLMQLNDEQIKILTGKEDNLA